MPKFPEPPTSLATAADVAVVKSGTVVWRIYETTAAHPVAWDTFRFFGPTAARFDHHDPPPTVQSKGILYGAKGITTCLAEAFQAARFVDRALNAPWLVGFELQRDLPMLDLTGAWPTRAGASMAINTGPRSRAQRWSRLFHGTYPNIEGLLYPSSMHANTPSFALYERARSALPAAPTFHRALLDPTLTSRLSHAASTLGYGLI